MKHYRITKYNPEYRNSEWFYTREDWSDISDTGKIYDFKKLRYSEYKGVEDLYFSLVSYLYNESWVENISLKWLTSTFNSYELANNIFPYLNQVLKNEVMRTSEKCDKKLLQDINIEKVSNNFLETLCKKFSYNGPHEGIPDKISQIVYYDDFYFKEEGFEDIFRLIFRGIFPWYKLYFWKSYIHFWYDLYVYIYCKNNIITDDIIKEYCKKWLFIEEWYISPLK